MVSNINCFVWFKQNNLLLQKKAFHETSLVVGWRQWPVVGDSKMLTNGVMLPVMGMMGQTSIMVRFPKIRASQHHADVTTSPTVICTYRPWSRPRWQTLSEKFQTPQICRRGAMKEGKLCMRLLRPPIKLVSEAFKEDQTFRGTARGDVNCKLKIKSNYRKHRKINQKLIFYFICHINIARIANAVQVTIWL